MKTFRNLIRETKAATAVLIGVLLCVLGAQAQDYFTLTGTAYVASNSYAVIPRKTGVPCVFAVSGSVNWSDNTNGATLVFYTAGPAIGVTRAGISATNTIYLTSSNTLVAADYIILERNHGTAWERQQITSITSSNITIVGTTGGITAPGDKIYRMSVAGRYKYSDLTYSHQPAPGKLLLNPSGQPWFSGNADLPALIDLQGTTTNTLDLCSGRWLPVSIGK